MAFSIEIRESGPSLAEAIQIAREDAARRLQKAYATAIRRLVRDATRAVVAAYPRVTGRLRRSLAVVARRQANPDPLSASYRVQLIVSNPGAVYHDRVLAHPQHRELDGFVNRFVDRNLRKYASRAITAEFS